MGSRANIQGRNQKHKQQVHTFEYRIPQSNEESHKYYEKHKSKEWQFGKNPEFNQTFDERFDWGGVEFRFFVKENKIQDIKIFTDSLLPDFFDNLNELLKGLEYKSDVIISAIKEFIVKENYKDDVESIQNDLFELIERSI